MNLPLEVLLTIGSVTIFSGGQHHYIAFISDLDICNDGSGPSYGDKHYQSQTAYYNGGKFLNADFDRYIVIPPQIRRMVKPKVMGCRARLTNLQTATWSEAVCGEIGPDNKTGEAAFCIARLVNTRITHTSGDKRLCYLYELWPGIPAEVEGKKYALEPAG